MSALMVEEPPRSIPRYAEAALPPRALEALSGDLEQSILARVPMDERHDPLLARIVRRGLAAFLDHSGRPVAAAEQVAPLAVQLGSREASCGRSLEDRFTPALELVASTVAAHAPRLLERHPAKHATLQQVREDLTIFLDRLHQLARRGFEERRSLVRLSPAEAHHELRHLLFAPDDSPVDEHRVQVLLRGSGLQYGGGAAAVVAVGSTLQLDQQREGMLRGIDGRETVLSGSLADRLDRTVSQHRGTAVVGPIVEPSQLRSALLFTRRAARILATRPNRPAGLVQATDLLAEIVMQPDTFTGDLLVRKHCGPLVVQNPGRRLDLAELLLHWLESGKRAHDLAGDLLLPTPTLYHRLAKLREMYGAKLENEHDRVELALALRHALPGWREQVREQAENRRRKRERHARGRRS